MLLNEPIGAPIRKGPPRPQDAIAPIPATANAFDMTSEDEIGDTLTLLAQSGDAISMYASGSREPVLGRILSVDPEQPYFVMELNEGARLPPGDVTFVAWLRTAKLQFRLSDPKWGTQPGKPNLVPMTFPATCAVLNRRTSERVEPPVGASYMASFVMNGQPYELPVFDVSLGGIALRCAKPAAKGLLKGRKLRDVRLELGADTVIVAELDIRVTRAYRSFLLGEQLRIGCSFANMPPEMESSIQKLLNQISQAPRQR